MKETNLSAACSVEARAVSYTHLPASKFVEVVETTEDGPLSFADEHVIGVAKGCDDEMIKDLNNHFMGECTEAVSYTHLVKSFTIP